MKQNKSTWLVFFLLVAVAALYRAWDGRPYGFAPQIAMAIFGGALIRDKRLAFFLPIFSMFLSDVLYQVLYANGLTDIRGFYKGQWMNYCLFAGLTCFGFLMKKVNTAHILGFSLSGSLLFFLSSNFLVWISGGGLSRPRTFEGLLMCYGDGLAFYRDHGLIEGLYSNLFIGDIFFSFLMFGIYALLSGRERKMQQTGEIN
jgi:hypothetical protein